MRGAQVKCELTIIPAPEPDASVVPTPASLEAAAAAAEARGVRVRALLVTNPGNPTGVVLPQPALQVDHHSSDKRLNQRLDHLLARPLTRL